MQDPMDMDDNKYQDLQRWTWTVRLIGAGIVFMLFLIWTAINRANSNRAGGGTGTVVAQAGDKGGGSRPSGTRSGGGGGGSMSTGGTAESDHPCHIRLENFREALRQTEGAVSNLSDLGVGEPPNCPENDQGYLFARDTQSVACRTLGHENF